MEQFIAWQQFGKQVPAEMNMHATIEEPVSKQWIGKHAYNNWGIVGNGVFLFGPCNVVIKKSSIEKS
jgi:hypothetical protein